MDSYNEDDIKEKANINCKNKRKEIKKSGLIYKLGNVSDKTISLLACIAVGLVLLEPAVMFGFTFYSNTPDVYMMISYVIISGWVLPFASVITFIIYLLVLLRIRNENRGLVYSLKKNPLFIVFSLTVFWMFISQIYNMNNGLNASFTDTPDFIRNESFDMQYSYFLVLLFAGSQVRLEKHKKVLIRSQLFVSILVVICAFMRWKADYITFLFEKQDLQFCAYFTNLNYYGYYLATLIPLVGTAFIYEKNKIWKVIAFISFVVNTVGLSLNNSTGAWVASAMGVLFIIIAHLIIEKKINIQTLFLIPIFCICLYIPGHIEGTFEENISAFGGDVVKVVTNAEDVETAGTERIKLWMGAMDVIKKNKVFGIGFEGVLVREYRGSPYMTRPHNEFLQHAMFYGIPMAVMYICGCFGVFLRALRKKKYLDGATLSALAATFGYLVSSFFGLTVHSTAMFLFVFMGMGYVRESEDNQCIDDVAPTSRTDIVKTESVTILK